MIGKFIYAFLKDGVPVNLSEIKSAVRKDFGLPADFDGNPRLDDILRLDDPFNMLVYLGNAILMYPDGNGFEVSEKCFEGWFQSLNEKQRKDFENYGGDKLQKYLYKDYTYKAWSGTKEEYERIGYKKK